MYPTLLQPFFSHICLVPVLSSTFCYSVQRLFSTNSWFNNRTSSHVRSKEHRFAPCLQCRRWIPTLILHSSRHRRVSLGMWEWYGFNEDFEPSYVLPHNWQLKPPKNQRLEDKFLLWGTPKRPIFRGNLAVSFREGKPKSSPKVDLCAWKCVIASTKKKNNTQSYIRCGVLLWWYIYIYWTWNHANDSFYKSSEAQYFLQCIIYHIYSNRKKVKTCHNTFVTWVTLTLTAS